MSNAARMAPKMTRSVPIKRLRDIVLDCSCPLLMRDLHSLHSFSCSSSLGHNLHTLLDCFLAVEANRQLLCLLFMCFFSSCPEGKDKGGVAVVALERGQGLSILRKIDRPEDIFTHSMEDIPKTLILGWCILWTLAGSGLLQMMQEPIFVPVQSTS